MTQRKALYGTLILLTVIYILSFVDRQIVAVLGVQIRDSLSLSNFQLGLLYGPAFSFIYAVAGIPMGRLADIYSRKVMICLGLLIWSIMTVISGFATGFLFLVTARFFVGISQSMLSPSVHSYLADTFSPERRAAIFSYYASGIFIGVGLSFVVGGSISMQYDWRTAMIVAGIPGIFLVPIAWLYLKEPQRWIKKEKSKSQNMMADVKNIIQKKSVQWHLLGFSALACTGYTILAFAGNILSDVFGAPQLLSTFGWFMFGVAVTVIISGKIADIVARKNPARRYLLGVVAALGGIPFYGIGLFADNAETALLFMGCGVLISSSYNGVAAALLQFFVQPSQRALAGGIYLFVISIAGFGLGPPVAGWLTDSVFNGLYAASYSMMSIIVVCGIIGAFSFLMAMKHYHRDAV